MGLNLIFGEIACDTYGGILFPTEAANNAVYDCKGVNVDPELTELTATYDYQYPITTFLPDGNGGGGLFGF